MAWRVTYVKDICGESVNHVINVLHSMLAKVQREYGGM